MTWNVSDSTDTTSFTGAFETTLKIDDGLFAPYPTTDLEFKPVQTPPVAGFRPLVVTETFVFGSTSAFAADRFAKILQSCVQLYDRLLDESPLQFMTREALKEILSADILSSECFAAFSTGDAVADATGGIEVRVIFPDTAINATAVGVSGTCVDAGDIERMFQTSLTEAGTFRVPPVCVSQIKYHLFSVPEEYTDMKNTGTDPIVLRGTAEFADDGEEKPPGCHR